SPRAYFFLLALPRVLAFTAFFAAFFAEPRLAEALFLPAARFAAGLREVALRTLFLAATAFLAGAALPLTAAFAAGALARPFFGATASACFATDGFWVTGFSATGFWAAALAALGASTTAKGPPCGSSIVTIHEPPGTSIGPLSTRPP